MADNLFNAGAGRGLLNNMGQPPEWVGGAGAGRGGQGGPAFGERELFGVNAGAEADEIFPAETEFKDANGNVTSPVSDTRVRIRVPSKYLTRATSGNNDELSLSNMGGIIFPYTPSISYDVKADYSAQNPLHSNFAINFYQRSSIGPITITGKFSVENSKDAGVFLATRHLLMALTRMRSGGATSGDSDSGAPPPICRLDAHGEMLRNVPVAISSFRVELPDSVDYITINNGFGLHSVPTISTIAITCLPMYSRDEMQKFSVNGYLNKSYNNKGYI